MALKHEAPRRGSSMVGRGGPEGLRPEERQPYRIELRPVNPDNVEQMDMLLGWFKDPRSVDHLVGVPETREGLADYYRTPGVHGFIGVNPTDGPVSVGTLRDPGDPEAYARTISGLVERVCVRPDSQRRRRGIGTQTAIKLLDKAFSTREEGGLEYSKLGLGVVIGPRYWEYARNTWFKVGFWYVGTRVAEIIVERGGRREPLRYDVLLMETSSERFDEMKHHLIPEQS